MSGADALVEQAKRAYAAQDLRACEALCKSALMVSPKDPAATLLIGFCCFRTRRAELAAVHFQSALEFAPDFVEAHVGLCSTLFRLGRLEEAKLHGYRAIELEPDDPANRLSLARHLRDAKQFSEAVPLWRTLVEQDSRRPEYLQGLAICLSATGEKEAARKILRRLVEVLPANPAEWMELGRICLAESAPDEALECAMRVLELDSSRVAAHTLAAMALSEKGDAKRAEEHLRMSIAANPNDAIAIASLGLALQEQGRFSEAEAPLHRSVELWPTNGLAYYALARSRKIRDDDRSLLDAIHSSLLEENLDPLHRTYMQYALGKGFEDLGKYADSMRHFEEANRLAYGYWLAHRPWNRERYTFTFDRTIESIDALRIRQSQADTEVSQKPLFVIGMIRSGTTLVEQILSSHPEVAGAGEMTFWHEQSGRIFDPIRGTLDREEMGRVAAEYLKLLDGVSRSSLRVTDKLPHNYALVGIIKAAIPGARFVHIGRNPLDNALSIFTTAYQRPPAFTLNRENIVYAYQQYQRMMAHWREVIPAESLLEIEYEDLVANREAVTRRMIEFTGLAWNDACLSHERNERSVHTPSTWQVRQPIYKTSIERWRRFEPWIAPFDQLLD